MVEVELEVKEITSIGYVIVLDNLPEGDDLGILSSDDSDTSTYSSSGGQSTEQNWPDKTLVIPAQNWPDGSVKGVITRD
jgi:hypothetical protein